MPWGPRPPHFIVEPTNNDIASGFIQQNQNNTLAAVKNGESEVDDTSENNKVIKFIILYFY